MLKKLMKMIHVMKMMMMIHLMKMMMMVEKTVHLMIQKKEDEMEMKKKMRSRWGGSRRWKGQKEEEEGERSRGRS